MSPRVPIAPSTEIAVLTRSARRCALCFALDSDIEVKRGQIAHLDHDSSNSDEDNLAFLCLTHHDIYDSKTSQSKGFKVDEVKLYRSRLYDAVEQRHLEANVSRRPNTTFELRGAMFQ